MILGRGVLKNTAASTFMWHTICMPSVFLITVLAMIGAFIIHSLILAYHWLCYSLNKGVATLWLFIYMIVGLFFLFLLFGAAIALS